MRGPPLGPAKEPKIELNGSFGELDFRILVVFAFLVPLLDFFRVLMVLVFSCFCGRRSSDRYVLDFLIVLVKRVVNSFRRVLGEGPNDGNKQDHYDPEEQEWGLVNCFAHNEHLHLKVEMLGEGDCFTHHGH